MSSFAASGARADENFSRQIITEEGQSVYIVNARAPHLFMISRDLYGDEKSWKDLAHWNHLRDPYALTPGQHLVLKREPTTTAEQGDEILMKAWAHLEKWRTWQGIAALRAHAEKGPAPASVTTDEVSTTVVNPVSESHLKITPEHEHESKWEFTTAAATSIFRLESTYSSSNIHNVLYSDVDYGVEVEVSYRLDEDRHLFFGASAEHMDIRPAGSTVDIDGDSQNVWHFGLGMEQELTSRFAFTTALYYEQDPFSRPTPTGTSVDLLFIPQLAVGGHYLAYEKGRFSTSLLGNLLVLFPRDQDSYHLKTGAGVVFGPQFQNKFERNALTYGLSYRYLSQDSTLASSNQQGVFGNIGLIW